MKLFLPTRSGVRQKAYSSGGGLAIKMELGFNKHSYLEAEQLKAVAEIREYKILANYGDYLGIEVQAFRSRVHKRRADPVEEKDMRKARKTFSMDKLWTDIAGIAKSDEDVLKLCRTPNDVAAVVMEDLIRACRTLGIDHSHMLWVIQRYALRNRKFHNDIKGYLRKREWLSLATEIHRDLNDIPRLLKPEEVPPFEKCVRNFRDRYFIVQNEDNPRTWRLNDYASQLGKNGVKGKFEVVDESKGAGEMDEEDLESWEDSENWGDVESW
ncbi:MAG: hypothetical protein M1839_008874 [Geoglossum umbratile]|nr:MAG: hypothetical protein M1839_008874 [Geoglossum umbratile]